MTEIEFVNELSRVRTAEGEVASGEIRIISSARLLETLESLTNRLRTGLKLDRPIDPGNTFGSSFFLLHGLPMDSSDFFANRSPLALASVALIEAIREHDADVSELHLVESYDDLMAKLDLWSASK
jgi:hypothetical protein